MHKYETERDIAKTQFWCITVIFIIQCIVFGITIYDINVINPSEFYHVGIFECLLVIIPVCIVEFMSLRMWYPYLKNKEKAFLLGEQYDGKIVQIIHKKKGKLKITPRSSRYIILKIQYQKEGVDIEFESEVYVGETYHYIPRNGKCKVYEYKKKAYVQDFYYIEENSFDDIETIVNHKIEELKKTDKNAKSYHFLNSDSLLGRNYTKLENLFKFSNEDIPLLNDEDFKLALAEREVIPPKSSNKHILMPGIMISDGEKQAYVFVELQINSIRAYDFEDFKFYKELNKFLRINAQKYFLGNVEEYTGLVKEFVTEKSQEVLNKDENFILNNVLVAIRNV